MAAAPLARPMNPITAFAPQPQGHPEGSWVCVACENINFPDKTSCNKRSCGKPRAEVDGGPAPSVASQPPQSMPKGNGRGGGGAPEGSWNCTECGNLNFPQRTTCNGK